MKLKELELNDQNEKLRDNLRETVDSGNKILTDKDFTIENLELEDNILEKDCHNLTNINRDLTVLKNDINEELEKCRYDYDLLKEELSTQINLLNHSIKDNNLKLVNYQHDSECQLLSRDETLRILEEKLKNLHEDRISKEKQL